MTKKLFTIILLIAGLNLSVGQTIPLGSPMMQDYLRREQLLGILTQKSVSIIDRSTSN